MHFEDDRAVVDEPVLEVVDGAVAALDLVLVGELVHASHQHVLVVRAVEDPDHPGVREARSMRHRKSWASSSLVGFLNDVSRRPLGFSRPSAWSITPPLPEVSIPCSTTSNPAGATGVGVGVHPLLQVGELLLPARSVPSWPRCLRAVEEGGVARVQVRERDGSLGEPELVGDGVGHGPSMAQEPPGRAVVGPRRRVSLASAAS